MKRIAAVACMLLGLVVVQTAGLRAQTSETLNFTYPSFSGVSFLSMNGTAEQANSALRLTEALPGSAGGAYYSDRMLDLTQPIHSNFSFLLHDTSTPVPADGITFTIQAQGLNALGRAGGGLGYAGITPSMAVEFNTFPTAANPGGNQVGIDENGSTAAIVSAYPKFSLYGAPVYAWVDYDPTAQLLQVYVSQTNLKPATPLLSTTIKIASVVGPAGWVGFTGGTGTDTQVNDVTSWTLAATAVPLSLPTAQLTPGVVNIGGVCYVVPSYTYSPSCSVTPLPTAVATRPLVRATKTMSVSGPVSLAGGTIYDRTVTVTSDIACFSLAEPIDLYTLGNPAASALRPLTPANIPTQNKNHYRFSVDPATHTATFSLETLNAALDSTGLGVKAVWPDEVVERISTLVAAATATPTATAVPGGTSTATLTATAPTSTPSAPGSATPTPTATPAATGPFTLRTCIDQNPVPNGGVATIFGQTTPGAVCTSTVQFPDGSTPVGFDGSSQTALSDGFVLFPFAASKIATSGVAVVTCTLNGQSLNSTTPFLIAAAGSPTSVGAGTLRVGVTVNPSVVRTGQQLTVNATTTPGALCVAQLSLSSATGFPFNGYAQTVPSDGMINWTFTAQTSSTGPATAIVNCTTPTQSGIGSASFSVSS